MRIYRSKKNRFIKKMFKLTGYLPLVPVGRKLIGGISGLYWYKVKIPRHVNL